VIHFYYGDAWNHTRRYEVQISSTLGHVNFASSSAILLACSVFKGFVNGFGHSESISCTLESVYAGPEVT
jgi:hypothetical protein